MTDTQPYASQDKYNLFGDDVVSCHVSFSLVMPSESRIDTM